MWKNMRNNGEKELLVSYELFDFITLFSIKNDDDTTYYNILGIPVLQVREIRKGISLFNTRYYLFGFPVAETDLDLSENDDNTAETEKYFDIES